MSTYMTNIINVQVPLFSGYSQGSGGLLMSTPLQGLVAATFTGLTLWMVVNMAAEWTSGEVGLYRMVWLMLRVSVVIIAAGAIFFTMLTGGAPGGAFD